LAPRLLPTLHTGPEVSSKILGGADLFLQGVLIPEGGMLEPFLAGSIRSVSVPGNPIPFAIGVMAVSSSEVERDGMKGRGLTLMHTFGDYLWKMGTKVPPNDGFTDKRIIPILLPTSAAGTAEQVCSCAEPENSTISGEYSAPHGSPPAETLASLISDAPADEPLAGMTISARPAVDMDAILESAALGGLKNLKNSDLPIMISDFYARHMQPLKLEGLPFDFKQSKYKKLSKLLDALERDKVLTQKNIRKPLS